jgi:hypothetical protein
MMLSLFKGRKQLQKPFIIPLKGEPQRRCELRCTKHYHGVAIIPHLSILSIPCPNQSIPLQRFTHLIDGTRGTIHRQGGPTNTQELKGWRQ